MTDVLIIQKCRTNQWTGFYMIRIRHERAIRLCNKEKQFLFCDILPFYGFLPTKKKKQNRALLSILP